MGRTTGVHQGFKMRGADDHSEDEETCVPLCKEASRLPVNGKERDDMFHLFQFGLFCRMSRRDAFARMAVNTK